LTALGLLRAYLGRYGSIGGVFVTIWALSLFGAFGDQLTAAVSVVG
jgi:hypothetical protein